MNALRYPKILITGANGLVGRTLQAYWDEHPEAEIIPLTRQELDITRADAVQDAIRRHSPDYVINCAAYTQVDRAEVEKEKCYAVNVLGTAHLAQAAASHGSILIHLSTDYVFDGKKRTPYTEEDAVNPLNYYGYTKMLSEEEVRKSGAAHYILRPAWIYGRFGNNFFHRVLQWAEEKEVIYASNDQTGSPTNAEDLAAFMAFLIRKKAHPFGLYHFSNEGQTTRYEMVAEILRLTGHRKKVIPVDSSFFKPLAKRPPYSVLSKQKVKSLWNYPVPEWRESLEKFIKKYGYAD